MAAYRGKNLVVTFGGTNISGTARSISFEQAADTLDDTVKGQDEKTYIASLKDGSGAFEALDSTGDFTLAWEAVDPGTSGSLVIQPEGPGTGKRQFTFTAIITNRSLDIPYDDLSKFSLAFQISGAIVETTL